MRAPSTACWQRGFDPNTPDEKGQVGLYLALREGSLKVAEVLLQHPQLKVDAANAAGETPLMMAALRGNVEWTQRLLGPRRAAQPRGLDAAALRRQRPRAQGAWPCCSTAAPRSRRRRPTAPRR